VARKSIAEQNNAVAIRNDADRLLFDYLAAGPDADIEMQISSSTTRRTIAVKSASFNYRTS